MTAGGDVDRRLLELMVQECLADGVVDRADAASALRRVEAGHRSRQDGQAPYRLPRDLMELPYLDTSYPMDR